MRQSFLPGIVLALLCSFCAPLRAECVSLVSGAGGPTFWRMVEEGARQAAEETGLHLHFRGPLKEPDAQAQLRIIERMLAHDCRALIVAPSGPEIAERLRQLKAQGIAGFYIDRDLGGDEAVGAVVTDNHQAGLQAGRQMARLLRGRGRVGVLRPASQASSVAERASGFIQGARAGGLEVVLEARVPVQSYRPEDADLQVLESLDGLFSVNERTTQGILAVLRRSGRSVKPLHIGFDFDVLLVEALRRGELTGLMLQQPWEMGYRSVWAAHRHLRGDPADQRRVPLEALYVDAQRLDDPAVSRLLRVGSD
jgi:ribose transport system substrate-binding protein